MLVQSGDSSKDFVAQPRPGLRKPSLFMLPVLGRDPVTQLRLTKVRPAGGEPDFLAHFQNLWS